MDSLKICSLLKTGFCPSKKEMNWNDFNYHKKGVESSGCTLQHPLTQLAHPVPTKFRAMDIYPVLEITPEPLLGFAGTQNSLWKVFLTHSKSINSVRKWGQEGESFK